MNKAFVSLRSLKSPYTQSRDEYEYFIRIKRNKFGFPLGYEAYSSFYDHINNKLTEKGEKYIEYYGYKYEIGDIQVTFYQIKNGIRTVKDLYSNYKKTIDNDISRDIREKTVR